MAYEVTLYHDRLEFWNTHFLNFNTSVAFWHAKSFSAAFFRYSMKHLFHENQHSITFCTKNGITIIVRLQRTTPRLVLVALLTNFTDHVLAKSLGEMADFNTLNLRISPNSSQICICFCKDLVAGYCLFLVKYLILNSHPFLN